MKVSKRIEHKINLGNYESVTLSAWAELEIPEGIRKETALDEIDQVLEDALEADIKKACDLADRESYIRDWRK